MEDGDAREIVSALLTEFAWRADTGLGSQMAELFTETATVTTPRFNLAGRAEIHAWFSERATAARVSRHFWSNLRLEQKSPGLYAASAYALTVVGASGVEPSARVAIGTSNDEILIENGAARFKSRTLLVALEGKLAAEGTHE